MRFGDAWVTGVGQTAYVRAADRSAIRLGVEAILAAAEDAGLDARELDGIVSYPGHPDAESLISTLWIREVRFRASTTIGGASAVSGLGLAALAVSSGAARHVLLLRATRAGTGKRKEKGADEFPNGRIREQLEWPIGWNSAAQRYALLCRRYMDRFGLTRDQLAEVALAANAHAQLAPGAQLHGKTLTRETYFAGGVLADPFWRYDCCLRTDGACAVIVSGRPRDAGNSARIVAATEGHPSVPDDMTSRPDLLDTGLARAAARLWDETGLTPGDMDAAMIYDCFTFEVVHQLAAAGFVTDEHAGDFVASGAIRLGGSLPVNTSGGLLAEGNMSGLSHVVEAARQVRGEAAGRQIPDVRRVAVTGWGNLGDGSIAVLEADHG